MIKKTIIISPYSKKLRNTDNENPKNYPFWHDVVFLLKEKDYKIIQIGIEGEERIGNTDEFLVSLPFDELKEKLKDCFVWISVDNMINHLGAFIKKPGICLFGFSDPRIYGYEQNVNLLKDRKYLRKDQFGLWESIEYNQEVFVEPQEVVEAVEWFERKELKN